MSLNGKLRAGAAVSVGKRLDRTHFHSFNGGKVLKNNTRNILGSGGRSIILTSPTRQSSGPLPLGPTPAGERAQLTPSKVMGPASLCGIKLARTGLKEGDTSSFEIALENPTAEAQEDPEGPPQPVLNNMSPNQRSNTGSKLTEDATRQGGRVTPAGGPHKQTEDLGSPEQSP